MRNCLDISKKSRTLHPLKKNRGVEQLVARQAHNLEVARSNPASATNILLSHCNSATWRISQFIEGTKVEIFLPHVYVGYHSLRDEE